MSDGTQRAPTLAQIADQVPLGFECRSCGASAQEDVLWAGMQEQFTRANALASKPQSAVTATDILREWFGGERYARDYEYLDANFGEQAARVVDYLSTTSPVQAVAPEPVAEALRAIQVIVDHMSQAGAWHEPPLKRVRESVETIIRDTTTPPSTPDAAPVVRGLEWKGEEDDHVLVVAKAIAEEGFGRPWDDFLPINAFDTDQADLKDYARAAVAALRSALHPIADTAALDAMRRGTAYIEMYGPQKLAEEMRAEIAALSPAEGKEQNR